MELRHYDNTYKDFTYYDFTYNSFTYYDFTYNNNKCDITYMFLFTVLSKVIHKYNPL